MLVERAAISALDQPMRDITVRTGTPRMSKTVSGSMPHTIFGPGRVILGAYRDRRLAYTVMKVCTYGHGEVIETLIMPNTCRNCQPDWAPVLVRAVSARS
jgi:hypothetical protein